MPLKLDKDCNGLFLDIDNQLFVKMDDSGCMTIVKGGNTETKMCLTDFLMPIEFYDKKTFKLSSHEEKTICFESNDYENCEVLFFDDNTVPFVVDLNGSGYISQDIVIDSFTSGDFDLSFDQSFSLSYIQLNTSSYYVEVGDIIQIKDVNGLLIQTLSVGLVTYDTNSDPQTMRIYFNEYIPTSSYFIEIRIPIIRTYTNYVYVKTNDKLFTVGQLATFRDTNGNDGSFIITSSKGKYEGLKGFVIKAYFNESETTLEDIYLWKHVDSPNWEFGSLLQVLTANFENFMNGIIVKNPTSKTIKFEILMFV